MTSVLRVPGIDAVGDEALAALVAFCARRDWDADAIATVVSLESRWLPTAGASAWATKRTASGLIQFVESTAKSLGVPPTDERPPGVTAQATGAWSTWTILRMPIIVQLALVELYYERAFRSQQPTRLVDYYLATWGASIGLPMDTVLATRTESVYAQNSGLDYDRDGAITVSDLDEHLRAHQAKAPGRREVVAAGEEQRNPRSLAPLVALVILGVTAYAASQEE